MKKKKKSDRRPQCKLCCPKCHVHWGNMKFQYNSRVKASDITVIAGKHKRLKDGDALKCTSCGYCYTDWDVMLAVAESGREDGAKALL